MQGYIGPHIGNSVRPTPVSRPPFALTYTPSPGYPLDAAEVMGTGTFRRAFGSSRGGMRRPRPAGEACPRCRTRGGCHVFDTAEEGTTRGAYPASGKVLGSQSAGRVRAFWSSCGSARGRMDAVIHSPYTKLIATWDRCGDGYVLPFAIQLLASKG